MNSIRPFVFAAAAFFILALLSSCGPQPVGYISTIVEYEEVAE